MVSPLWADSALHVVSGRGPRDVAGFLRSGVRWLWPASQGHRSCRGSIKPQPRVGCQYGISYPAHGIPYTGYLVPLVCRPVKGTPCGHVHALVRSFASIFGFQGALVYQFPRGRICPPSRPERLHRPDKNIKTQEGCTCQPIRDSRAGIIPSTTTRIFNIGSNI